MVVIAGVIFSYHTKNNTDTEQEPYYSLEVNRKKEGLSQEFFDNQNEAEVMKGRFISCLLNTYTPSKKTDIYTVDGIGSDGYPEYYAGSYINTDGKLIIQIKDSFYSSQYRSSIWYKELVNYLGSEDFACNSVKYSYKDIIDAMTDLLFGKYSEEFKQYGIVVTAAGIDDLANNIDVYIDDADKLNIVEELLPNDLFVVILYEGTLSNNYGVHPGEAISLNSYGNNQFSVACRARICNQSGVVQKGFFTCAHAFSGSANVYLDMGSGFTNIGYSNSTYQLLYGTVDVAFVSTNNDIPLYNNVYLETTTLYDAYTSVSVGSVVYKRGVGSNLQTGYVLCTSFATNIPSDNTTITDLVQADYYAVNHDSGGIIYTQPNSQFKSYSLGIHKGNSMTGNQVNFSFYCKMSNVLYVFNYWVLPQGYYIELY